MDFTFLSDPQAAAAFGQAVACFLPAFLALIGAIVAACGLANRANSRLAIVGLTVVMAGVTGLLGCMGFFLLVAMRHLTVGVGLVVAGFASHGFVAVTVGGAILALVGANETRRGSELRGRKRAYLGVGVAVCVLAFWCYSLASFGFKEWQKHEVLAGKAPAGPGATVVVKDLDYTLTLPAGWQTLDPKKLMPLASTYFSHALLGCYGTVVVETPNPGAEFDLKTSVDKYKELLRTSGRSRNLTEKPERLNGIEGMLVESDEEQGTLPTHYAQWMGLAAGRLYRLQTWGPVKVRATLDAQSLVLRGSFHLLSGNSSAVAAAERAPEQFRSSIYNWSVDLRGTWWTRSIKDLAKSFPQAEWAVQNESGTATFWVIPIWIGREEADPEALTQAMLHQLAIPYPSKQIYGLRNLSFKNHPEVSIRAMTYEGTVGQTPAIYFLRVLSFPDHTLLLAACCDSRAEKRTYLLEQILDRVQFQPSPPRTVTPWMTEPERKANAVACDTIAEYYYGRKSQLDSAVTWLARAYSLQPKDGALFRKYLYTAAKAHPKELGSIIDREIKNFADDSLTQLECAYVQLKSGDREGGFQRYAELFAGGFRDDAAMAVFLKLASDNGLADRAAEVLERYSRGHESKRLSLMAARAASDRKDYARALAILEPLSQSSPDTEVWWDIADFSLASKKYEQCVAACEELAKLHETKAGVDAAKGYALLGLKRYREAKEALDEAHRKDPADPYSKRTADYLAGLLGQGANQIVNTRIDPAPLPTARASAAPVLVTDDYLRGYDSYYREFDRAIVFDPGHELKTTERQVIKIVDQQGAQRYNTIAVPFDPFTEEVFANSLVVKDAADHEVATGKIDDSYVSDNGSDEAATQMKTLHIPVPSLQPGYTIDVTFTRRETGGAKSFVFRSHYFSHMTPVLRSTVALTAPPHTVKWEASPGVTASTQGDTLAWTVERPTVLRMEPYLPPLDRVLPNVSFGAEGATWEAEGKEYLSLIKDRLAIEPDIRRAAEEAVRGQTKEADKIRTLARLAQHDLSYKAIEFGRRARIPNPAAQTLRNRYGDCKDHALLLCQMLEAAGIHAQLALVSAGGAVRPTLPSLEQFNHMIVCVPSAKGAPRFIDCTSKSSDLGDSGPPPGLEKQQALVLDEAHPRLLAIPDYAPTGSGAKFDRVITVLDGASDLSVRESIVFRGVLAGAMRASLQQIQPAERHRVLLQMMNAIIPSLELQEAEVENVEELDTPLRLRLLYLVRQKCQTVAGRLIVQPPAPWERMLIAPTPVEKRYLPFWLRLPAQYESSVKIAAPAGWRADLPERRKLERPFCTAALAPRPGDGAVQLDYHLDARSGEWPAAQYAAYTDAMAAALGLVEGSVLFEKR